MGNYVKDAEGKVYRVNDDQVITREQIVDAVAKAEELLETAKAELLKFDSVNEVIEVVQTPVEQAQEIAQDASELAQSLAEEAPVDHTATDPTVTEAPVEETPTIVAVEVPVAPVEEAPVAPTLEPETPPANLEIQ